jgi:hypothetical protein
LIGLGCEVCAESLEAEGIRPLAVAVGTSKWFAISVRDSSP